MLVSGGAVSIVQVREAGVASTLPNASMDRTSTTCEPSVRPEYDFGELHDPQVPASSRHSKVEPGSLERNTKLAEPDAILPEGPDAIVVSGAVVSILQLRAA